MEDRIVIADVIVRKIKGEASDEDEALLDKWMKESSDNKQLFEKMNSNEHLVSKSDLYDQFDQEKVWSSLDKKLFEKGNVRPIHYLRYAAAILIPLLLLSGLYYFVLRPAQEPLSRIDDFVKPGDERAVLILSDGAEVDLTDERMQREFTEGGTQIVNRNNTLTYSHSHPVAPSQPVLFNELVTPRGGRYFIVLPDGTKVWVNAASSLKFPVTFSDSIRQVHLEGEAYFDVTRNGKPFVVNTAQMDTRVLGTKFNVTAYREEPEVSNTLEEGSVQILAGGQQMVLSPGKRATLSRKHDELTVEEVNTRQYTSWVNGKIEFTNEDLETVMRRLARWYDFAYVFENENVKGYHFTGRIDNKQPISSILEMMQMTTDVTFGVDEQTIVVE